MIQLLQALQGLAQLQPHGCEPLPQTDRCLRGPVNSSNSIENIKYKFEQAVDELLLDFVTDKTNLYKKLTDKKVNRLFKKKWFEGYYSQARAAD